MTVTEFLRLMRRAWPLLVAGVILGLLAALTVSLLQPPRYTSTARVFVSVASGDTTADELTQGNSFSQDIISSYAEVAASASVLGPVRRELGLTQSVKSLAENVDVSTATGTVVMTIAVQDKSPVIAARIANSIADRLQVAVAAVTAGNRDEATVKLTPIVRAEPSTSPSSPNVPLLLIIGALLGLALAAAAGGLRASLATRVTNPDEAASIAQTPVISHLIDDSAYSRQELVMIAKPLGPASESIRSLRTALRYLQVAGSRSRIVVVTSAGESEGKTSMSANLALALSATSSVIVVDADLRRPALAGRLGLNNAVGLTDYLVGEADLESCIQSWGDAALHVIAGGPIPPNPSELLEVARMAEAMVLLSKRYEYVIIDTPPLGPVSDALIVAKHAEAVLLACAMRRSRKNQLRDVAVKIKALNGPNLALVATFVRPGRASAYSYYGSGAE